MSTHVVSNETVGDVSNETEEKHRSPSPRTLSTMVLTEFIKIKICNVGMALPNALREALLIEGMYIVGGIELFTPLDKALRGLYDNQRYNETARVTFRSVITEMSHDGFSFYYDSNDVLLLGEKEKT